MTGSREIGQSFVLVQVGQGKQGLLADDEDAPAAPDVRRWDQTRPATRFRMRRPHWTSSRIRSGICEESDSEVNPGPNTPTPGSSRLRTIRPAIPAGLGPGSPERQAQADKHREF